MPEGTTDPEEVQRELDDVHHEDDRIRALRPGQPFRDDRHERECECHGEHEDACRLERLAARSKNDENAREPGKNATNRPRVIASFRNGIARIATQAGDVNSSAKTVASGRRVRAYAQPSVPAKCRTLRSRCSLIRRGFNCGRSSGRKTAKARSRTIAQSVADGKDFEDRQGGRQFTHRDGGRRERHQRSSHPENDRQYFRDWHV